MSRGVNKVILIGNLGSTPELRHPPGEHVVTSFRLAVNRPAKRGGGENSVAVARQDAEWFTIVAWDRLADFAVQYLRQGWKVYVEGRLQSRKWRGTAGGEDRWTTEVVAHEIIILASKPRSAREDAAGAEAEAEEEADMPAPGDLAL